MPSPSDVLIRYDGGDVTPSVLYAETSFELVGTATPGTATVVIRDPDRVLNFTIGKELTLDVDGVRLWGGLVMDIERTHFFPAVDSTSLANVHSRKWVLTCSDYNIWLDKRVLRNTNDYLSAIMVPAGKLGAIIRQSIPLYMDVPPGLDFTSMVEDTQYDYGAGENNDQPSPLLDQGIKWREQFEWWSNLGGYPYFIDAQKRVRFHEIESTVASWGFVDRNPNDSTTIGFREGSIREDGMQMVTDALVWGGRQGTIDPNSGTVVFARYPDPPANDQTAGSFTFKANVEQEAINRQAFYGRWQRAERRIGQVGYYRQRDVLTRAYTIVAGPPGFSPLDQLDGGLGRPVWQISLSWFAHDVPGFQHLEPGQIVDMTFYTMGSDLSHPLPLSLPLRTVTISFPTLPSDNPNEESLAYVRFDGQFGISYSDHRNLWRFLQRRRGIPSTSTTSTSIAATTNQSTQTLYASLGTFTPSEAPDGVRRVFTIPFGYLSGTTQVDLNGLVQRLGFEYTESNPGLGEITFSFPPHQDDTIYITCRTGAT